MINRYYKKCISYTFYMIKNVYILYIEKNNIYFYEGGGGARQKKSISIKNIFCFAKNKNVKSFNVFIKIEINIICL